MTALPSALVAALADRYRLERELGQGGMATVYLARDLKHDRDVAIKVLHPDLAAALGAERFLAEIRTTANLQHPHILPLHDSGAAGTFLFYVMPFVDGETLRTRLSREQLLPIPDALRIAAEVADALNYAHGRGVIHRDIKPENILLQGGHALVADFGIALAVQSAGGQRMTQTGLSLGTPHYMSPEQAMGERTVDARTDIYALGAITYEMLTGDPPFAGSTVQAIVAKVLTERPTSLRALRDTVPEGVEHAVFTALAKLPADRFATAAAFSEALAGRGTAATPTAVPTRTRQPARTDRRWLAAAAALLVAVPAGTWWLATRRPLNTDISRQQILLYQQAPASPMAPGTGAVSLPQRVALTPDGGAVVFVDDRGRGSMLFRKDRAALEPVPITGSEGATGLALSPDGRSAAFATAAGELRTVPVEGGAPVTLASNGSVRGGTAVAWLEDGTIVFSDASRSISRISARGGEPVRLTLKGVETWNGGYFQRIPGANALLVSRCNGNCGLTSQLDVLNLETDSVWTLVPEAMGGLIGPTGHLLYTTRAGGLFAAPFDLSRLALNGPPVALLDHVEPGSFRLADDGTAIYRLTSNDDARSELVWVGRDGLVSPVDSAWRGRFEYPAVAPGGRQLAVSVTGATGAELWVRRDDGRRERILGGTGINWRPFWTRDGRTLAFISTSRAPEQAPGSALPGLQPSAVWTVPADGSAPATLLQQWTSPIYEVELSADGQWLVFRSDEGAQIGNVRARRLVGDTTVIPLLVQDPVETQIALSPDSRWLAYTSNESGIAEIYVSSFPDMRVKRLVSTGGDNVREPRWSKDGKELFFKARGFLQVASFSGGAAPVIGSPRQLFPLTGYRTAINRPQYDVAPDGKRFLMIRDQMDGRGTPVVYVEGWLTELRAKLAGAK